MGYWGYYPPYISVAEKKEKAAKKLAKLKKKNPNICPVVIEGKNIAQTWWGKSWNQNLERYADYSNRIGRGRSYVKNGMVLDLQIEPGEIKALVQGTSTNPYSITISIKPLTSEIWNSIKQQCQGQLDSMQELLSGKFPKSLNEIFTAKGQGLFPSPAEIKFSCSCPDWASMCKHVAAALYGVGARLDEDPKLFFTLRKIKVEELITEAVKTNTRQLLEKADKKSKRSLENVNLSEMFGIELGSTAPAKPDIHPKSPSKPEPSKASKTITADKLVTTKIKSVDKIKQTPKAPLTGTADKQAPVKTPVTRFAKKKAPISEMDLVEAIIIKSRKGVNMPLLMKKTGIERTKLYSIIHRLKQQNRIISPVRGVYQTASTTKP